jgi:NAD(P)H-hydrate epimerase
MDRRAIEEFGIPGAVLMENAGAAAADVALEMLAPRRAALILAGAGNNAGDGFVIARHLANHSIPVEVITAVTGHLYKGDAALNYRVIAAMGLPISTWQGRPERNGSCGLIIDALLGTGLSGDLRAPYPDIIDFANESGLPVLAVDMPSGLDGDTGRVHTAAVKAAKTVTFALPKRGLFAGDGPRLTGEVIVADIGMPASIYPPGKALWQG